MTERIVELIVSRRQIWIAAIGLLSLFALVPAGTVRFDNSLEIWFLEDNPELALYNEFSSRFHADEIVVVGIFADDVFHPETLSAIHRITAAAASLEFVYRVRSITNSAHARRLEEGFLDGAFRRSIMASPALVDALVTADGRAAAIVVYYGREGDAVDLNARFVNDLEAIAARELDGLPAEFELTGSPVMGEAAQSNNRKDLQTLPPLMILIIVTLAFAIFRNLWLTLLPLTVVAVAAAWTYALMGLLGWPMTMISAMLTPLVLAVGVADTIHVVGSYQRHMSANPDRERAVEASIRELLLPCLFTSITTIMGLLALTLSEIGPLRQFGVVAAFGVFSAFAVSITLVPALLLTFPVFNRIKSVSSEGGLGRFLSWVNRQAAGGRALLWSITAVVVVASLGSAQRISYGLDPLMWFPEEDPFRVATGRVDEAFGGSLSLEFMVAAPEKNLNDKDVLRRLEAFESWLSDHTVISRTLSISGIVKEAARVSRDAGPAGYALPNSQFVTDALIENLRQSGQLEGWLLPDFSGARISARMPAATAPVIIEQIPAIEEYLHTKFANSGLALNLTGQAVMVGQMQTYVFESQAASFTLALVTISILMILLLRSVTLGLLAMIPNLVPLLAGLGAMSMFDIDLNPGTVMITAVALGIVIDDTVHMMTAIKRNLGDTSDVAFAVKQAVRTVGRPIVVTSILLALGFSILMLGSFLPSREIGGVTALIIVAALCADLLLVPAAVRSLPARLIAQPNAQL